MSEADSRAGDYAVLTAARDELLAEYRDAVRDIGPALSIDDSRVRVEDQPEPRLVVPVTSASGGCRELRLRPGVISRAREEVLTMVTLVACALASTHELDDSWRAKRVGLAQPPSRDLLNLYTGLFRLTDAGRRVEQALEAGRDVLLIGKHGSGKTPAAAHFAERYEERGQQTIWLDPTDPADGPESILATLLCTAQSKEYLLVIDGVHANLPAVERVLACVLRLRSEFGLSVRVLATGWQTVTQRLPQPFKNILRIPVRGEDLINKLVNGLGEEVAAAIRKLAGDDVYLAAMALRFHREDGRIPTRHDLQQALTRDVVDPKRREALYWLACLGFFEIDVSILQTRKRFAREADWLLDHKLIWPSDSSYMIGPRARAGLLLRHALEQWEAAERWGRPADLTWEYLQRSDERTIKALLSRLDLTGVAGKISKGTGTDEVGDNKYLLTAWEMLGRLERHLERLCAQDPRWGDRFGAAAFAAMAMAASGRHESWEPVGEYLRSRWRYPQEYELPAPDGDPTADFADFLVVQQRMAEQDAALGDAPHLAGQRAGDIDLDKSYRMWVLGLLLGVESTAPPGVVVNDNIDRLVEIARRAQDPDGSFYPQRVSWITARVVLGLCQTGARYDTSKTVRRACDWLVRPVAEGGAFQMWWRSGTGSWNSDEVTTALCLTALFRAGAPRSAATESALGWLIGQEARWMAEGRDVDLAHALEALLLAPTRPPVAYQHVAELLRRTLRGLKNPPEPGPDMPEEGHRMSFATAQLASLVWTMVNREFTNILDEIIKADADQEPAPAQRAPAPPPTPTPATPPAVRTGLSEEHLGRWREAAAQLRNKIDEQLNERAGLPELGATKRQLDQYLAFRASCERLTARLGDQTPREVLVELDTLGRQVCGRAWPNLPWPPATGTRQS